MNDTDKLAFEKMVAGLLMNAVAQEQRHVMRCAARRGMALDAEATVDYVYSETLANVIKRFPAELAGPLRAMLDGDALRSAMRADLRRHADADWLR
ncbi:MAG: hypothetical protein D6689_18895 [Deltaproteobacteria bacterium]|nr:MAG: hypothetical protein D6689_18895 [Deltaproteobacteria bacterium]